jgi:hypothetical protein
MKEIPRAAIPVVKILRRDVPRPNKLPVDVFAERGGSLLRWEMGTEEIPRNCCPMGLHPKASVSCPVWRCDFPIDSAAAIDAFGGWWDSISERDAKEAMDAIWG